MKKNTWRKIVEVLPGKVDSALETLAVSMGFEENIFSGVDINVLKDAEYITAVPIEIALTSEEREVIINKHPEVKYVVTKVRPERVNEMVACLDYDLISIEDYISKVEDEDDVTDSADIIDADSYYQVGGTTVKGSDIYTLLGEDPEVDLNSNESGDDKDLTESDENGDNVKVVYSVNGKEVSRDEFFAKVPSWLATLHKFFVE